MCFLIALFVFHFLLSCCQVNPPYYANCIANLSSKSTRAGLSLKLPGVLYLEESIPLLTVSLVL